MEDREEINLERQPQALEATKAASGEATDTSAVNAATQSPADAEEAPAAETVKALEKSEKTVKHYQRIAIQAIVIIAVLWVLFFKVIGLTHMPSGDMFPRVDAGDMVLFYRLDTDVAAQDIIVLEKETPDSNGQKQMFISRVVAKGGDVVEVKDNKLIVNGNTVMEDKIFYPTVSYEGLVTYPITLGPDECFVLADKRDEGADSRFFGPVKRDEIQGSVITIVRRNNL